jgi:RNA-splicing ligase RtcB
MTTHQIINVEGGAPIRAWTTGVPFEAEARAQLERIARLPFIHRDEEVLDETPMAYKSIDQVMEAQRDLVEVAHTLRQVVCVKG